jgi:flagellar protein FliS
MTRTNTSSTYLKTKILTANPGELMVMMYNGAVNACERAREKMRERKFDESCELIVHAENILLELSNGLRKEIYPELVANLSRLFEYTYNRLVEANCTRDPQKLADALDILVILRDTWVEAIRQESGTREQIPSDPTTGLELSA